jgi:hypothetical protein
MYSGKHCAKSMERSSRFTEQLDSYQQKDHFFALKKDLFLPEI